MGCTLSTGQIALSFSKNLQCWAADSTNGLAFTNKTTTDTIIDESMANMLGFTLILPPPNTQTVLPNVAKIEIGPTTTVKLHFKGMADAVDPQLTAIVIANLDTTGKNINMQGTISQIGSETPLPGFNLTTVTGSTAISLADHIVPMLPISGNLSTTPPKNYKYELTEIHFASSSEHYSSYPTSYKVYNSPQHSCSEFSTLFVILLIIFLILMLFLYINGNFNESKVHNYSLQNSDMVDVGNFGKF